MPEIDMPVMPASPTKWDRFIYWCARFYREDFDEFERDYKLVITERLQAARAALLAEDPSWIDLVDRAITAKPNNLTNWRATQPLLRWFREDPDTARLALRFLWNDTLPVAARMDKFDEITRSGGHPVLIAETSFFHMANDPWHYPMYRATSVERAMDLTGYPMPGEAGIKSHELGKRYEHFLRFLDIMTKRAAERGLPFRDRLDAQSAIWVVTKWDPLKHWPEPDQHAFREYQAS